MKLTYDPSHNAAYMRLRDKAGQVETICLGDELNTWRAMARSMASGS
jgi:uncharacterized protein YuzE